MELNIDKTEWKSYRFDEFAQNISQRVDPKQTDLEIYVGLEHLDPDSLHIKRNGTPADVEGTKLKFYTGDVIFGKRRAYQRKAALAKTDGICSAHAMVLRANTKLIDERLFPFFFHSKVFQDIAVKISVGGLSPTINWKDLAKQEFFLPPKDQQAHLAELLWAADEVVEREREVKERLENVFEISKTELLWSNSFPLINFKDVTQIGLKDGDWIESKDQSDCGVRLIQLADIGEGIFLDKSNRFISEDTFKKLHCFEVKPRDILLARMPDPIGRSCIMPDIRIKCITAVDVCIIRIDEENFNVEYVNYLINTVQLRSKIIELSSGTTRQRISKLNLGNIKIPMPNKFTQDQIVNQISVLEQNLKSLIHNTDVSNRLKQGLINEIL